MNSDRKYILSPFTAREINQSDQYIENLKMVKQVGISDQIYGSA